jgi:hypothetical protein
MISEVIKGDIKFLKYIFCLTPNLLIAFILAHSFMDRFDET